MNCPDESALIFVLETPRTALQSSWSRVLVSGKRASRRPLVSDVAAPLDNLALEKLLQKVLVGPVAVFGLANESGVLRKHRRQAKLLAEFGEDRNRRGGARDATSSARSSS